MKRTFVGSRVKAYATIKEVLGKNYTLLKKALLAIYDRQGEDEQEEEKNLEQDNMGFDSWQCIRLTRISKQLLARKYLCGSDREYIEKQVPKYVRQIFDIGLAAGHIERLSARRYKFVY